LGGGNVQAESSVVKAVQSGERTTVAFRDWPSSRDAFWSVQQEAILPRVRTELDDIIAEHDCKVLALDMATVTVVPSALLGMLIAIHKSGITVELLHTSQRFREALEATKLHQVFVVRD
jgi:hypothetical protein